MGSRPRRHDRLIAVWVLVNICILGTCAPIAAHLLLQRFDYNQLFLIRLDARHLNLKPADGWTTARTVFSSGWNILRGGGQRPVPDFRDPERVFAYAFSWLPSYAIAYPTEGFYYFRTDLEDRSIGGNFRLAELERGLLVFTYFDRDSKDALSLEFGANQGLSIERLGPKDYRLNYEGKSVRFVLTAVGTQAPRHLKTLSVETFMGQVYDESGIRFFLFFNEETDSFYYVLNEEDGVNDDLRHVDTEFYLGARTGFLFFHDEEYDRKLFVGVDIENVVDNSYLDGPPDQVPYDAVLRPSMIRAYPGTKLGAGIDEHGVRLGDGEWARVAVVACNPVVSVPEFVRWIRSRALHGHSKSILWTSVTKESWNHPAELAATNQKLREEGKEPYTPRWIEMIQNADIDVAPSLRNSTSYESMP
jgi:hypothetical protein